ncbi:MAG: hypothetical protein HYZ53_21655 [Planctomycetes bacterium]|nr:hypothetical protein [Planctomycetota bacterium]
MSSAPSAPSVPLPTANELPRVATRFMTPRESLIYAAVVDAVIPRTERLTVECVDRIVLLIDGFLEVFPWYLRTAFRLGLHLLEYLPLFSRHLGRMSRLSRTARTAFLESWLRSRWVQRREFVKGFIGISLMGFYTQPEVRLHIGFDHQPSFDRLRAARMKLLDHDRQGH